VNPVAVYRGLPVSVYVVFIARIVNSLGNFVFPFLSLFLTTKLGLSKAETGFFIMLASTVHVPGSMLGGKLSDHMGRKLVVVGGMTLSALSLVPCALLGISPLVPWLVLAAGFFMALSAPAQSAMITDLTTPDTRKATFSLLYLGHNIGFAVGPMIAGFLFRSHLPLLFLGDAATTLLSIALVARFVPETAPHAASAVAAARADGVLETEVSVLPESERAERGSVLEVLLRRPILLVSSFLLLIYSLVYSQHIFSLPIQMQALFGDVGAVYYGTLMSVNAITVVVLTSSITTATLKVRPMVSMGLAGLFFAAGFGMIYLIHSVPLLLVSTVVWTIGEVLNSVNSGVFIANNSPSSHRGRISAVLDIIAGAGFAFGPWLGGMWIEVHPIQTVWAASFFLALGTAALMFFFAGARGLKPGVAANLD